MREGKREEGGGLNRRREEHWGEVGVNNTNPDSSRQGVSASDLEADRRGRGGSEGVASDRQRAGSGSRSEADSGRGVSAIDLELDKQARRGSGSSGDGRQRRDSGQGASMDSHSELNSDRKEGVAKGGPSCDKNGSFGESSEGFANGQDRPAEASLGFEYEGAWQRDSKNSDEEMIPSDPMLAETHYSQYDDFETDDSEQVREGEWP